MATQPLPFWEPKENGRKNLSILSANTLGQKFYQPLQMGHQKFPAYAAPTNFSIVVLTMGGIFFGGGGGRDYTWVPPVATSHPAPSL